MNFLNKTIFKLNKPPVIIVFGNGKECTSEAIYRALRPYFKVRKVNNIPLASKEEILIFTNPKNALFIAENSSKPILVGTHIGDIPHKEYFFSGDRKEAKIISKLIKSVSFYKLILNFDDETVRELGSNKDNVVTYGFQDGADTRASNVNIDLDGTNFKLNYDKKIIPFWLNKVYGKEQIYSALSAICVGLANNINLIQISKGLKSYNSIPGKMRLIQGVKKTLILDNSKNESSNSMIESLDILKNMEGKRKIAVLGDILKDSIEAHETIGEKVSESADILFTFGQKAKFISLGARRKGLKNIFEFDDNKGKIQLQKELKQGDIVLIDGLIDEIVDEIKKR